MTDEEMMVLLEPIGRGEKNYFPLAHGAQAFNLIQIFGRNPEMHEAVAAWFAAEKRAGTLNRAVVEAAAKILMAEKVAA